jgi:hypothetical protein
MMDSDQATYFHQSLRRPVEIPLRSTLHVRFQHSIALWQHPKKKKKKKKKGPANDCGEWKVLGLDDIPMTGSLPVPGPV